MAIDEARLRELIEAAKGRTTLCQFKTVQAQEAERELLRIMPSLLSALAAADRLREAVEELRAWGVEHDDDRLHYLSVQVGREDVRELDEALSAYAQHRDGESGRRREN